PRRRPRLFPYTTLFRSLRGRYRALGGLASATALLWLVHPLHTQSVTYIVQRMTSLAALFYLATLVLYARARLTPHRRTRWVLGRSEEHTSELQSPLNLV